MEDDNKTIFVYHNQSLEIVWFQEGNKSNKVSHAMKDQALQRLGLEPDEHTSLIVDGKYPFSTIHKLVVNDERTGIIYREDTPEEITTKQAKKSKSYLSSTDWYYARLAETEEPVPDDVVAKRIAAREFLRQNGY